ncbi:MAG: CHAP domain-containing protein [Ruminococcaceae bacterium]|nr:CHAP domain-containing protein [Oscillospiraceae bacterium]
MAKDIKTVDVVKDGIKTVDKASIGVERIKDTTIKIKNEGKDAVKSEGQENISSYASSKVETVSEGVAIEAAHQTKEAIKKAPERIKRYNSRRQIAHEKYELQKEVFETEKKAFKEARENVKQAIKTADRTGNDIKKATKTAKKGTEKVVKETTIKTAQAEIKSAEVGTKATIKTAETTAKGTAKATKVTVESAKKAEVAARETIKASAAALKAAMKAAVAAGKVAAKAIEELIAAIAEGGWVVLLVIAVVALIAGIVASTYGIFFSSEDSGTGITMSSVVQELNMEFLDTVDAEKNKGTYDEVYITGSQANWKDIIAIYAIKTNTDADNPQEIATIDENKKGIISDIFWDMNTITTQTETKTEEKVETTTDEEGNEVETVTTITKTYLTITISSKSAEDMIQEYGFTDEQKAFFYDLTDSKNDKLWNGLIFGMNSLQTVDISAITFTNEEAGEVQKKVVSIAINSSQYGVPANKGYCQAWVADVLQIAVGTRGHAASAVDAGRKWSVSKDWSQIQVGAAVYGYSSSQWGHVGIYIGDGMVAHNIGGVKIESLSDWVSTYKGVCWGWEQGINLSGNPEYDSIGGLM